MDVSRFSQAFVPISIRRRFLESPETPTHEWIAANPYLTAELSLPEKESEESLFEYLSQYHSIDGASDEFILYLREAYRRFLYTLQIVPEGNGRLLEIGASPYFSSLLLRRFRDYDLTFTNYLGAGFTAITSQTITSPNESVTFDFTNINIEEEALPFEDGYFDVVLLCEVLEHFTNDAAAALLNLKRVLRSDGNLIVTTPNVNRLVNVARMISGDNVYDPYSGYGPYGRHNREYNRHELVKLLEHMGFTVEEIFTSDVYDNITHYYRNPREVYELVSHRKEDLGQYIFVRATNAAPAHSPARPAWLYRSYPDEELSS